MWPTPTMLTKLYKKECTIFNLHVDVTLIIALVPKQSNAMTENVWHGLEKMVHLPQKKMVWQEQSLSCEQLCKILRV